MDSKQSKNSQENTLNPHLEGNHLPPRSKNTTASKMVQVQHQIWEGPLPPPAELEKYNKIDPTFAERVFVLAEGEALHRRKQDETRIHEDIALKKRGQIFALVIALAGLVIGGISIHNGHDWAGVTISGTSLIGLVGVFLYKGSKRHH